MKIIQKSVFDSDYVALKGRKKADVVILNKNHKWRVPQQPRKEPTS